jgi:iron(III) transport system substrate-binding protein
MLLVRSSALIGAAALLVTACQPPMAASPTAAPPKPTTAPAATSAPAAKPTEAAKPAAGATTAPAAKTDSVTEMMAKYYDAAKTEGTLVVYGAGPPELFTPVRDAFIQRFPGLKVEGVDQRGRETREKLLAEQQSKNVIAGVAISGYTTQQELRAAGSTEQYTSPQLGDMIPEMVAPGGFFSPRSTSIFSVAVNTNLVPAGQEPKEWKDILDPKYKGKIAADDPRGSGPGGTIVGGTELLYGQEFSQKLAEQQPFFATQAGPLWAGLVRGEYALFISASHSDAIVQRKQGAPIKFLKIADGVGTTYSSMSLVKNAPAPNAAKLFIEWTMSEEGQTELAKVGYASVRKGQKALEPEADLVGVKVLPPDNDANADAKLGDINARTKRWEELFFKS